MPVDIGQPKHDILRMPKLEAMDMVSKINHLHILYNMYNSFHLFSDAFR